MNIASILVVKPRAGETSRSRALRSQRATSTAAIAQLAIPTRRALRDAATIAAQARGIPIGSRPRTTPAKGR
jgi:hypothetical protein